MIISLKPAAVLIAISLFFSYANAENIELVRDPYFDNGYTVGSHNADEMLHPDLDIDTQADQVTEGANYVGSIVPVTYVQPAWSLAVFHSLVSVYEGANNTSKCLLINGQCIANWWGNTVNKTCTTVSGDEKCVWESLRIFDTQFHENTGAGDPQADNPYDVSVGVGNGGVEQQPVAQVAITKLAAANRNTAHSSSSFRLRSYAANVYENRPYRPDLPPNGVAKCGDPLSGNYNFLNPNYSVDDCNPNDRNGTIYSDPNLREVAGPHLLMTHELLAGDLSKFSAINVRFKARLTYRDEPEHAGHVSHPATFRFGGFIDDKLTDVPRIAYGIVVTANHHEWYPSAAGGFCQRCQFVPGTHAHEGEFLYTIPLNDAYMKESDLPGAPQTAQLNHRLSPGPWSNLSPGACPAYKNSVYPSTINKHWAKKKNYQNFTYYVSGENEDCAFQRDTTNDQTENYAYLNAELSGGDVLGTFYERICFAANEVNQTQSVINDPIRNVELDYAPLGLDTEVHNWNTNWNYICGVDSSSGSKDGLGVRMFTVPAYKALLGLNSDPVYAGINSPLGMVNTAGQLIKDDGSHPTYYSDLTYKLDVAWSRPASVDAGPFQYTVDVDANASDATKYHDIEFSFDLLPYFKSMIEGFPDADQWAKDNQGLLKWAYTRSLDNYYWSSFDLGWEIHETANIEIEVSDLSVTGELKPNIEPSAAVLIPTMF